MLPWQGRATKEMYIEKLDVMSLLHTLVSVVSQTEKATNQIHQMVLERHTVLPSTRYFKQPHYLCRCLYLSR